MIGRGTFMLAIAVTSGLLLANEHLPGPTPVMITAIDFGNPSCVLFGPEGLPLDKAELVQGKVALSAGSRVGLDCVPPSALHTRMQR